MSDVAVEIKNNRIYISSGYGDKDKCKQIGGTRWDREVQQWHAPVSWSACKQLRTVFGERLGIGPDLLRWAQEEFDYRIRPCTELRMELSSTEVWDSRLFAFQRAGVSFLRASGSTLLSDPTGAGKTAQAVVAAKTLNALPALVICPASTQVAWSREIETWWPGTPVHIVDGSAAKRAKVLAKAKLDPGFCVMKWEVVRLHSRLAPFGAIAMTDEEKRPKELNEIPWKLVIADEAHRLKDCKSKQTRATWAAAKNAPLRWALTATPLTSAPDTLYPILRFLSEEEWPVKSHFIERYCNTGFNGWGGLEVFGIKPEMDEEFRSIFEPRFRRMPKEVVLAQLPPIVRQRKYVDMNPKQAKAYRQMAEGMVASDGNDGLVIAKNPISQLTRLVQYSSAFVVVEDDGAPRLSDPSCKLDALMADLDDYLSDGEGVVVFAQSRQLIELAEKRLEKAKIPYSVIKGDQTTDTRQRMIDEFQNKIVDVILVVIAAGGTGVNLHRARIGIFLQRTFSKVEMLQAEGRIHRIGSEHHDSVVIVDYISKGTIEEHVLDILEDKERLLEEIIRDKQSIRKLLGL